MLLRTLTEMLVCFKREKKVSQLKANRLCLAKALNLQKTSPAARIKLNSQCNAAWLVLKWGLFVWPVHVHRLERR